MKKCEQCPCCSGLTFGECCAKFLIEREHPPTPEALMRSRYTAYVMQDKRYLLSTWHISTRPKQLQVPSIKWLQLQIVEAVGDIVEFKAHHQGGVLHERSRFCLEGGQWFYVNGIFS